MLREDVGSATMEPETGDTLDQQIEPVAEVKSFSRGVAKSFSEYVVPHPETGSAGDRLDQQAQPVAGIEAISLGDATSFAEIELQTNQLLDYIGKLSSSTGHAFGTAIRQSPSARPPDETCEPEVTTLRSQLEESFASLERYRRELDSLKNTSKEQLTELDSQLRERDTQLNERETELKHLRAEITCLLNRLEAKESNMQTGGGFEERIDPLIQEIASLKTQLTKRDEMIQAKTSALRKTGLDHRTTITGLEQRLHEMEANMQSLEGQLKEKDAVIQATADKEAEIGKLIKQLSTECQNLNVELQEKTRLLNEVDRNKSQPAVEGNVWHRVVGRLQEEGV
jgi:DNA repair exonuclease SbcCD ATPase subunit